MNFFNIFMIYVGGDAGTCVLMFERYLLVLSHLDNEMSVLPQPFYHRIYCTLCKAFDPFCQLKESVHFYMYHCFCAHSAGCTLTGGTQFLQPVR